MNETVQDLADLNQLTGEGAAAAPTQAPAPKYEVFVTNLAVPTQPVAGKNPRHAYG